MAAYNEHAEQAKTNKEHVSELEQRSGAIDAMWDFAAIDAANWNKQFPYQLVIFSEKPASEPIDQFVSSPHEGPFYFTLPIPPESLTISTPFAINTQVTLGGVIEEHNGAPIRMLSFSGTLGVLPSRPARNDLLSAGAVSAMNSTMGFAAGTITAATAVATSAANAIQNTLGFNGLFANVVPPGDDSLTGSGYYQFRLLQKFLESYVNLKKKKGNEKLRLGVAIWKDEAVYLATPVSFEVRRSAASPLEYMYNLQFRAWKRVPMYGYSSDALAPQTTPSAPSMWLQKGLALISEARDVCEGLRGVAGAVRADLQQVLDVFRQTALFAKDSLSVAVTFRDLPANLMLDAVAGAQEVAQTVDTTLVQLVAASAAVSSEITSAFTSAVAAAKADSSDDSWFTTVIALSDSFSATDTPMPPVVQQKIQAEIERARTLARTDHENALKTIQNFIQSYSELVGATKTDKTPTKATPTDDDYSLLFALNQAALGMSKIILYASQDTAKEDAIAYVAGLATRSGIAFQQPVAKIAVPFPYGSTLEQIAARYLGDPKRWHEIAALNGLRTPYVDEEGFDIPLIANGKKNEIVVAEPTNLFVGQPVVLSATNTPRTTRRITKIDVITPQMTIVHLNGEEDLHKYTTMGNAFLHAYLPNTVNSQMQLYIPSTSVPRDSNITSKTIPGVNEFDPMLSAGGVDLLLTPSGDLAITSEGDCRLAVGLTNLVQRVRIALGTTRGSLPQHPEFGLGLQPGTSTADLDAKQLLEAAKGLFRNDPAFTDIYSASVVKKGPTLSLSINVGIAGQDIVLPVSVDVKS